MKNLRLVAPLYAAFLLVLFTACSTNPPVSSIAPKAVEKVNCTPPAESDRPVLLWSTPGFSAPESVVYDRRTKEYYVSNVVGSAGEKDGKGWISKLDSRGKMKALKWADGSRATGMDLKRNLDAPKGLGLRDGILWVTDIDSVSAFQTKTGKKTVEIKIPDAKFLNDLTFGEKGEVLVSDMLAGRIYSIKKSPSFEIFHEGRDIENPNGLTVASGTLLIAGWGNDIRKDFSTPVPGRVLSMNLETKAVTPWSTLPMGNLDGIEFDGPDVAIVSDWMAGKVYSLKKGGKCTLLLEGFHGSADLTFIPETRTLVIPVMNEDRVVAYRLP